MNDINLADITLQIAENIDAEQRSTIEEGLRALDGAVSVHNSDRIRHLSVVGYNPSVMNSQSILKRVVTDQGGHAELVGL